MITQLKHNARRQEEMFGSRWTEGGVEEAGIHEASRTNAKQAVSKTQADTTHDLKAQNISYATKQTSSSSLFQSF